MKSKDINNFLDTNILFDFLLKKILNDKKIEISNFMTIKLNKIKERKARNYYTGDLIITKPYNKIFFILSKKLSKKIMKHADIESYFKEKK